MAKVQVTVCDVCANIKRPTQRYRIIGLGRSVGVELCDEHSEPVRALINLAPRPKGPRAGFESAVATMEEIEERKRQAKAREDKVEQ